MSPGHHPSARSPRESGKKVFPLQQHFASLYSDSWNILEVLVSDSSPIDLKRLPLEDSHDAYLLLQSYGYDLDNAEDAAQVELIRREALRFIQRQFLDTLSAHYETLIIPEEIKQAGVLDLLLKASIERRTATQKWACAILRVMHTLAHVVSDLSLHFFPSIQDQILGPYYRHIRPDNNQMWLGDDPEFRLPLVDFQVKAGKDRDSALLKLLHKPENVAADLFDRIGVRFVTRDRLDAILVLHYLREKHLVAFPNVKPSRSVNTLIDIDKFRETFRAQYSRYETGQISFEEFDHSLRHSAQFNDTLSSSQISHLFERNPFTSGQYRSIQFTVRQLVRLENPLFSFMDQIEDALESMDEDTRMSPLLRQPLEHARPHYRFFFPYEIQIVDVETHNNNMHGQASHDTYKLRQLQTARKRVLGKLLKERPVKTDSITSDITPEPMTDTIPNDEQPSSVHDTTHHYEPIVEALPTQSWLLEETEPTQ